MRKTIILTLIAFSFLLNCLNISAQEKLKHPNNKTNIGIEDVVLEKNEVFTLCSSKLGECSINQTKVEIKTISKSAREQELTYFYLASAGTIEGSGANVIWDLSKVKSGTYTILVGVGKDGVIQGDTIIKEIVVRECPVCDPGCDCPIVEISAPTKNVFQGDSVVFSANIEGDFPNVKYKWTLSDGTILYGQETSQILVKVPNDLKKESLTANVEIEGLCDQCPFQFSKTIKISKKK